MRVVTRVGGRLRLLREDKRVAIVWLLSAARRIVGRRLGELLRVARNRDLAGPSAGGRLPRCELAVHR